ncbi:MAG: hypothetical protein VXU50_03100 [Verrucomicrobiota bacterium]|nr:hypothetical protein [Verrucomicrobiota bacterium]
MEDEPDTDVENESAPPTLSNLLTLSDHEGDEDEEIDNEGMSDGDHDDGDSIGTRSEEKNPSHPIENKFFYISQSNAIIPKHGYTIPSLRNIAVGVIYDSGNIHILQDLFNDPEGTTMKSIRSGLTSHSLAICLSLLQSSRHYIKRAGPLSSIS